ncbi:MAG TPA: OmpA family protein [Thermoanaerobaculia bacterium]|nr:OmpA family protein [Thermoanaerobaculia bacterium]
MNVTKWIGSGIGAVLLTACASSGDVERRIAESQARTEQKIESVAAQVEDLQERQKATEVRVDELSRNAAEALQRATEAGVLAKGQFVFQQTFAEDRIRFSTDSYDLSADARGAIDEFAEKVKSLDKGIYLEIQGFTDDRGSAKYNDMLGQQRAESVRRYLSSQHKLPLGRMSTISYGKTLPAATNKTAAGRAQNRRVVAVVLE